MSIKTKKLAPVGIRYSTDFKWKQNATSLLIEFE